MKKTNRTRSFLLGMLTMALLMGLVIPGVAASIQKTITVSSGVSIFVDGVEMKPTDVNGNPVETFIYNGTTYVPLRAVSQYLGKAVKWDGDNWSVYIGKAPGEAQHLMEVCPPYQTQWFKEISTVNMAGKKYANGFRTYSYGNGFALFNLDGKYNALNFDVGHVDGESMQSSSVTIYLDGEVAFSTNLTPEMLPTHYEVPLHGALQMKIQTSQFGDCYAFVNAEIR